WYGYVDRDLREFFGGQGFATRFCGAGDLARCRADLWAALDAAGNELQAAQGPDPSAWRADATAERIHFSGFLADTMRWANRPTFQQVVSFVSDASPRRAAQRRRSSTRSRTRKGSRSSRRPRSGAPG